MHKIWCNILQCSYKLLYMKNVQIMFLEWNYLLKCKEIFFSKNKSPKFSENNLFSNWQEQIS